MKETGKGPGDPTDKGKSLVPWKDAMFWVQIPRFKDVSHLTLTVEKISEQEGSNVVLFDASKISKQPRTRRVTPAQVIPIDDVYLRYGKELV
jgi:hypothetical protein